MNEASSHRQNLHAATPVADEQVDGNTASDASVLADAIRTVWRARAWFIYPALVGVLGSILLIVYLGLTSPSTTTYRFAISLTMPGADESRYPNGLPYAPTDIRSPVVVNEVFRRNQLDRFGIDERQFSSMVSVEAFSPVQEGIAARFRAQLSDRNLTTEERRAVEEQFRAALKQATADGAMITLTVPDNLRIPADVALKVAADLPSAWSEYYINVLGVGERPLARSEGVLIDAGVVATLDYPLAYDYVVQGLNRLKDRLAQILDLPGAKNAVLPDGSVTAYDLQRDTDHLLDINVQRILRPIIDMGLTRDRLLTTLSYNDLIEKLRVEEELASQRARIVSQIVAEGASADQQGRLQPAPNSAVPSIGTTSIPQFGDAFIDRIIGLSLSGAGVEFRQELLRQKLELEQGAAKLVKEREQAERRLEAINGFDERAGSLGTLSARFVKVLDEIVVDMNRLWKNSNDILASLSNRNLNGDKAIYSSLPIDNQVVRTAFYASPYLWLMSVGLVLFLGIAGLVLYILRVTIRRNRMA